MSVAKEILRYGKNNIWTNGRHTYHAGRLLPDLTFPPEEEYPIGVWGQRRLLYLKQHHKILYCNLLTSGKLQSHLADVEEEQKMNNIRSRAVETVYADLIFA